MCVAIGLAAGVDAAAHDAGPVGVLSSASTVAVFTGLFIRGVSAHPDLMSPARNLNDALRDARMAVIMLVAIGVPVYWRMEFTEPLWLQLLIMFVVFPLGFGAVFFLRGLAHVAVPRLRKLHQDHPRCLSCDAGISPRADFCQFCGVALEEPGSHGRHARSASRDVPPED